MIINGIDKKAFQMGRDFLVPLSLYCPGTKGQAQNLATGRAGILKSCHGTRRDRPGRDFDILSCPVPSRTERGKEEKKEEIRKKKFDNFLTIR